MALYLVDDAPGGKVFRLDEMTAPQLGNVIWANWPSRKSLRLRTALNRLAEATTGKRSAAAGNSRDNVVRFADAAD